jgi:CDP-4-dehydro-6-deoxyglucose reductase, E1
MLMNSPIQLAENPGATEALKSEILTLVRQYRTAQPGGGDGNTAGLAALIESLLDTGLDDTRFAERFEEKLAALFGVREVLMVNSGASANLVAVSSLTSPRMGKLQLKPGDEILTLAAGSPALVSAIVQNQLTPVFVDLSLPGFNVDVRQLQGALSSKTRAIAVAHMHGNPCDLDALTMFAAFNNLLLIEDCRDAAGASFSGRPVGCFGQFATASFHAGRQISTGEGGALLASTSLYRSIAASFRDGGRGEGGARMHAGYNLRASEMQAALGAAQFEGLAARLEERANNARAMTDGLAGLAGQLILPESLAAARPSWLELPVVLRETAPFDRDQLVAALVQAGVQARPYPPNLATQPAFQQRPHRRPGALPVTATVAAQGLLIKAPPAAGRPDVATMIEAIHTAVQDLR